MITATDTATLEIAAAKTAKFDELFSVLEDLLKRLADSDDPEIRRRRAHVRAEMIAVQNNPQTLQRFSTRPIDATDDWGQQALVALAGAAVALSVFRHSS